MGLSKTWQQGSVHSTSLLCEKSELVILEMSLKLLAIFPQVQFDLSIHLFLLYISRLGVWEVGRQRSALSGISSIEEISLAWNWSSRLAVWQMGPRNSPVSVYSKPELQVSLYHHGYLFYVGPGDHIYALMLL